MAGGSRQMTSNLLRMMVEGLNKIIDKDGDHAYYGPFEKIFPKVTHDKIVYEMLKLAGLGVAGQKGEGDPISNYDTLDQAWTYSPSIYTYEKSVRITLEAKHYNMYMNAVPKLAKELIKAHKTRKDIACAEVFNNAFSGTTYGDGVVLCSNSHPVQAGGNLDNLLTLDFDHDSFEQAEILIDAMVNDDGLIADYMPKSILIPYQLKQEVDRVLKSQLRPGTADNDINIHSGQVEKIVWKRLDDADAWFVLTNSDEGFCLAETMPMKVKEFEEHFTWDDLISSISMWAAIVKDGARAVVGSAGV